MRNIVISLSLAAAVFVSAASAYAGSDPAAGTWQFTSTGEALLGSPSGSCQANGTVPGSLYDSFVDMSNGSITIHNLGISIGATSCTSVNFQGSGTYTVADKGNGNYEVTGTLTSQFVGRGAACSGIALNSVGFTLVGKTGEKSALFTVTGLASGSYAEGPPPGPLTCTAPILNLTGSGTAMKF